MTQETTRGSEAKGIIVSSDPQRQSLLDATERKGYLGIIEDYKRQRDALKRRVEHLELVLAQRTELTENKYSSKRKYLDHTCDLVYQVFLKNPAKAFSYDEFDQEFRIHFPNVPTGHLGRRLRDLRDQERLWSDIDPETREVRFWLRLELLQDDRATP